MPPSCQTVSILLSLTHSDDARLSSKLKANQFSRDGLRTGSNGRAFRAEEDRKLNKALGALFQRTDSNKLTEDAIKACRMIDIRPEDLLQKGADAFLRDGAQKVSHEIAEVRFKHF